MRTLKTSSRSRQGFTLLELMCVIAIVLILVALLLPAVQQARESARSMQCRNNLSQIGIALAHYNRLHNFLPPGAIHRVSPLPPGQKPDGIGWMAQILPQMGEELIWLRVNPEVPAASGMTPTEYGKYSYEMSAWTAAQNDLPPPPVPPEFRSADDVYSEEDSSDVDMTDEDLGPAETSGMMSMMSESELDETPFVRTGFTKGELPPEPLVVLPAIPLFSCPSSWGAKNGPIVHYAGCHNSTDLLISDTADGLLYLNSSESLESVPDGTSNTLLVGETQPRMQPNSWLYGDGGTLKNADIVPFDINRGLQYEALQEMVDGSESDATDAAKSIRGAVGVFNSQHTTHVNFLSADGSVRRISRQISVNVLRSLVNRADGLPQGF